MEKHRISLMVWQFTVVLKLSDRTVWRPLASAKSQWEPVGTEKPSENCLWYRSAGCPGVASAAIHQDQVLGAGADVYVMQELQAKVMRFRVLPRPAISLLLIVRFASTSMKLAGLGCKVWDTNSQTYSENTNTNNDQTQHFCSMTFAPLFPKVWDANWRTDF